MAAENADFPSDSVITCSIAGAAGRATVSFSPNWASAFTYESVTLTCNVASTAQGDPPYSWYKDGAPIGTKQQKYTIVSAQVSDSGEYQCKSHNSDRSEAVTLTVSNGYLALKVPPYVFEGDNLQVSCAGYPGYYTDTAKLYKGNQLIGGPSSSVNFNFGRVTMATSGSYTCYRAVKHHFIYYNQESSVYISVKELFSTPQIKVRPDQVIEGDHMTITCDTKLSPHRETTELQFAFYRNGHNVQGFSLSNQYLVPSAQLEDSGYYTCEIRAQSGSVKKKSGGKSIQITKLISKPEISVNSGSLSQINEGDHMTITCDTELSPHRETTELQFAFYRNGHNVQGFSLSNQYGVPSAQLEDSGNYTCEVQTPTGSVRKESDPKSIQIKELISKPVISLSQINEGDHMTITCDTKLSPHRETTELQFAFYRNGHNAQGFSLSNQYGVPSAQLEDSGNYTCEVQTPTGSVRKRSNMVHIHIQELFIPPHINVSQYYLLEGDHMTITCDTELSPHRETTELQFAFYRNGHNVQGFNSSNQYGVPSAQLEDSGNYTCEVQTPTGSVRKRSDPKNIQVKELFSKPEISGNSGSLGQINEGDHMTITCDTELSPHRETTELQFAFYRNGHNVQGFSLSNQYGVPSAQLEDSGNYTCEVQTPTGSVRKESDPKSIQIKAQKLAGVRVRLEPAGGQVIAGEKLEILCSVEKEMGLLRYSWCKQPTRICVTKEAAALEQRFVVESVSEDYGGEYQCIVTKAATGDSMRSTNISISVRVKVELKLSPTKVAVGDSVDLLCESKSGSFPVDYQFYHRNDSIGKGKAKKKEEAQYRVTITSISMAGPYYCTLQNEFSSKMQLSVGVILSVMEPVADARITPGEDELAVIVEDNLCLTCSVAKGTNPLFLWIYNETIEHESVLYQVRESGKVLCIESAQLQHAGTYWCQVRNQLSSNRIFSVTSNNVTISISGRHKPLPLLNVIRLILAPIIFIWTVFLIFHHIKSRRSTDRAVMGGIEKKHITGQSSLPP
ncbi:Fc receptor-like protein 3 [Xenopus tropicalis]|uniref:Fc receptor-like protein 3 n=1 Tax=Xenopus tropicalis TaxID=8364 RepID=A0A8J1IQ30_XENTR|nr:Fc receptor-like protein 3 [Xenopus tropicalis]